MKLRHLISIPLIPLTISTAGAIIGKVSNDYTPYIIKKGETISGIVHKYNLTPLYGEKEWVTTVLKLNRLSYTSTKKVEPGDVVVLPVKRALLAQENTKKYIVRDEVKTLYSSWRSQEYLNSLKDKKHNLQATVGYRHKSISNQNKSFDIQQTFVAGLNYWSSFKETKKWLFSSLLKGEVSKSSDSSLSNNQNLSASFSSDYSGEVNLKLTNKNWGVSLLSGLGYNSESYIKNSKGFSIEEVQATWFKISLEKELSYSTYKITPGISISKSNRVNDFEAVKANVYMNLLMTNQFSLHGDLAEVYATEDYGQVTTASMSLGYRF